MFCDIIVTWCKTSCDSSYCTGVITFCVKTLKIPFVVLLIALYFCLVTFSSITLVKWRGTNAVVLLPLCLVLLGNRSMEWWGWQNLLEFIEPRTHAGDGQSRVPRTKSRQLLKASKEEMLQPLGNLCQCSQHWSASWWSDRTFCVPAFHCRGGVPVPQSSRQPCSVLVKAVIRGRWESYAVL